MCTLSLVQSIEIDVFHSSTQWGFDADHDGHVSEEEEACGKIVDEDHNGQIDESEKKAFIACLKGAKGDYDGDKDHHITADELRCGVKADKNHDGKIDADEIADFEQCLGIKVRSIWFKIEETSWYRRHGVSTYPQHAILR